MPRALHMFEFEKRGEMESGRYAGTDLWPDPWFCLERSTELCIRILLRHTT
jgi:hypothetical protein